MKNILLIGGKGELGQKIASRLTSRYSSEIKVGVYDTDIKNNISGEADGNEAVTMFIVSPPRTHTDYIVEFLELNNFKKFWKLFRFWRLWK